jgi:hypothetical protein
MLPSYCGVAGHTGWLVRLLLWAALLVIVFWGVRRLFPDRPPPPDPAALRDPEDAPEVPVVNRRH